jgi:hypothetical protein
MKYTFLVFLTVLGLSQMTKADTIAYWHVYYNKTKIREFNIYCTHEIILKLDRIKSGDSITVKYFRDTPCSECSTFLAVDYENHYKILTRRGKGTFNPISFSLKDLIKYKKSSNKKYFDIFYFEVQNRSVSFKENIFRIKHE